MMFKHDELSKHDEKRLKRIKKELLHWRKVIIRSFEEVKRHRYFESEHPVIRKKVDRDRELIKHIDPLIMAASELLGCDLPELEKVPRVTIRKV